LPTDDILEKDLEFDTPDPDEVHPPTRDVVTQPYDFVVTSLIDQINNRDIILRPSFQRGYVWTNPMASKLIESVILNVPIPPCYLSQNENFELDVVDGQQRLESIRRFLDNNFMLSSLSIAHELNGKRFFQLPSRVQRQIKTHTIRCVMITNKSHPDVKFDIFERLNTNTSSLNAQELRNCLFRGRLNDLLRDIAERSNWLRVLGRKNPDKRMRGEEIILRYFAFQKLGLSSYRTPFKNWLNDAARWGQQISEEQISQLSTNWEDMLEVATTWFSPDKCFRRPKSKAINKALFDLISQTASKINPEDAGEYKQRILSGYAKLLHDDEFDDLISRAVDHKKRTLRRFEMWENHFDWIGN